MAPFANKRRSYSRVVSLRHDTSGANRRQITDLNNVSFVKLAPGGNAVAFIYRTPGGGSQQLYVAAVDGSTQQMIAEGTAIEDFDWCPK